MQIITPQQARVLGSLLEKDMTTPEYYPMTLNALTNACNQKSNREPVVQFSDVDCQQYLDELREKSLVSEIKSTTSRVVKYKHQFSVVYDITTEEKPILCELLLRGPQTAGELRNRCARMYSYTSLEEIEQTLLQLSGREEPLVVKLPKQAGQKEVRYAHVLCGEDSISKFIINAEEKSDQKPDQLIILEARIQSLEEKIEILQDEILQLKKIIE